MPPGISSLTVDLSGAKGGANGSTPGGAGGRVVTTLTVTPGELLVVNVGGAGGTTFGSGGAGYNGGGSGNLNNGGGGGASDLRRGSDRIVVAAGGGGAANNNAVGGAGGTPNGAPGSGAAAGGAATTAAPGAGYGGVGNGTTSGQGGTGFYTGGGGGYYGGGGGGASGGTPGGGGGGSSYVAPSGNSGGSYGTASTPTGDGRVTLTPGAFTAVSVSNVPGDNLGNHTATTNLGLNGNYLSNAPANANGIRVDNAGSVGVNVAAPTQRLDVEGGILARSQSAISNQGAYLQWNRTGGDGETWLLNQQGGGGANAGIRFGGATTGNVATEWARFLNNGNFGIGTTNPGEKLDVAGNAKVSGTVQAGGSVQVPAANAYTYAAPKTYTITYGAADFQPETVRSSNGSYVGDEKTYRYPSGSFNSSQSFETVTVTAARVPLHLPQGAALVSAVAIYYNATPYTGGLSALVVTTPAAGSPISPPLTGTLLGSLPLPASQSGMYTARTLYLPAGTIIDNTKAYYLRLTGGVEYATITLTYTITQAE